MRLVAAKKGEPVYLAPDRAPDRFPFRPYLPRLPRVEPEWANWFFAQQGRLPRHSFTVTLPPSWHPFSRCASGFHCGFTFDAKVRFEASDIDQSGPR